MFDITATEWTAILLSIRVATVATLVATPLGIALAYLLARRDFWGKSLLDAAVHLPLVLPPVVTGYLLLLAFGRRGPIGAFLADHFGIVLAFRWTGAVLSCGVMSFPLLVRPMRLSIEAVDRRLEQAAETLGAAPWRVFLDVTLPLALPGVVSGFLLAFSVAISSYATPAILGGPSTETMPVMILNFMTVLLDWSLGSAMSAVLTVSALLMLFGAMLLASRVERAEGRAS